MPAIRPRATFEPIAPDFDLKALVESTPNFSYVDRISCDMIDQQGLPAFEKLILLHVIIGGKPLVIDGFEDRLDPWTFTPQWLRDNCGEKAENARNLTSKENLPLTMGHYLRNMGMLTNQFFSKPGAHKEQKRQRVYLKDIDCPDVWQDKLREHIPSLLFYLNESTGDFGGPGAQPDSNRRLGKGIARAGDLMSSLPPDMRAENLMCYIGHEGTYTPAHREMCASLGHNIMVEASSTLPSSADGKPEKPGSSIWFMTESKDRHTVSEYWLSVLGHDIEVENHFAQVVAWKKAPFTVYVVEQRPGDFILIPPLAPHQVWNRGTRTMKVAWNRTTVETLEMALNEALPRSRIVCRDEQYKNKAIIYYTLQKYSSLLALALKSGERVLATPKVKQLAKDFKRLFNLYKQILLSEMFNPEDTPKGIEYLPFDSNVTCAYCRGNIFNRFLTCPSAACKNLLGHTNEAEGDPYDVCIDCYAMGRSCSCISGLRWVEQFRWKELAAKYDTWRQMIIQLDGGNITEKSRLSLPEEKKRLGKKSLAEVCKEQLKKRPWKDVRKDVEEEEKDENEEEEIIVDDNGTVKKIQKKRSKAWLKNNTNCHVCCKRHPNWKMAQCTTCDRMWCYGTLFRGWDKMPITIMEDPKWSCPHCLGICFAGGCRREGKMKPYEPKGTLLGHDTKKVADARSVEALVDFSVSNLNWLKDDRIEPGTPLRRAGEEAKKTKEIEPTLDGDADESGVVEFEDGTPDLATPIDPALSGAAAGAEAYDEEASLAHRLQQANASMEAVSPPSGMRGSAPEGYAPVNHGGYVPPAANMYPQPDEQTSYSYPTYTQPAPVTDDSNQDPLIAGLRPFKRPRPEDDDEDGTISMKQGKNKVPRLSAAGFRSSDLGTSELATTALRANKSEAQRQFEKEKERQAVEKAKSDGRFIMLQAALKGKRRIVKLPIDPQKLRQVSAQQAARAALDAGKVEHEAEAGDGAAQQLEAELEDDADTILLKSDIAPKKARDQKAYYQQRQKEGYVISSASKKALIPVEKDGSYRGDGKAKPKGKPGDGAAERKKPARRSAAHVEYEEVDIGSEEDEPGVRGTAPSVSKTAARDRRSLPSYLQSKDEGGAEEDAEDFADVDSLVPQQVQRDFPTFAAVNRPVSNGTPAKLKPVSSQANSEAQRRRRMEEENRLAKLQALESVTGSKYSNGF
ncbi:hypothetical protein BDY17DRAFT_302797 [Neohortaea acidophila]|uniref:JmjC domain-containing protein n=1 Tax=Neohortaea acidophila TaxID=245834 RepID=A0A6A6PJI8_9PEZI|nr:uncharacterized protein BDY17DRAFT_302797 [Neohortaea acidophila]KAF2479854.1 hypothetical protein BDY17DRAFT_302797 [Neohortaea acidophila]